MIRKLPGTHKFFGWMVCDQCGHREPFDREGREALRKHLISHDDGIPTALRADDAPGVPQPSAGSAPATGPGPE